MNEYELLLAENKRLMTNEIDELIKEFTEKQTKYYDGYRTILTQYLERKSFLSSEIEAIHIKLGLFSSAAEKAAIRRRLMAKGKELEALKIEHINTMARHKNKFKRGTISINAQITEVRRSYNILRLNIQNEYNIWIKSKREPAL